MRTILLVMMLAGCSSSPTLPTVTRVPVPVPCVTAMPAKPDITPDAALKALSDYAMVLSLAKDRVLLRDYAGELEAILSGCVQ